jgi:hypothetical protein
MLLVKFLCSSRPPSVSKNRVSIAIACFKDDDTDDDETDDKGDFFDSKDTIGERESFLLVIVAGWDFGLFVEVFVGTAFFVDCLFLPLFGRKTLREGELVEVDGLASQKSN